MTDAWSPTRTAQLDALLTDRDHQILEDLEAFRALSTRLIQRLRFPAGPNGLHATVPTATRLTNRVLLRLETHGFIARIHRRVGGPLRGSAATTWHLAATGERFLRAHRGDTTRRRYTEPSQAFLTHTLAIAEFATTLREHQRAETLDVLELNTEPSCWRPFQGPTVVTTLKPDLFVVIASPDIEAHTYIEIDCGTEHIPAFIKKCRTYQHYRQTGIEQTTHGIFPAVLWITPDDTCTQKLAAALRSEPTAAKDLFTVCTSHNAIDTLAGFLEPSPNRKEVSP